MLAALAVSVEALRWCRDEVKIRHGGLSCRHHGSADASIGWETFFPPASPVEGPRFSHLGKCGLWRMPEFGPADVLMLYPDPLLALQTLTRTVQIHWHHPSMLYAAPGGTWTEATTVALACLLRRQRFGLVVLDSTFGTTTAGQRSAALARSTIGSVAPSLAVLGPED